MEHVTEVHARQLLSLFQPFAGGGAGAGAGAGAAGDAQPRCSPADALLQRLAGYDDVNYRVTARRGGGGEEEEEEQEYVLKIANAADSAAAAAGAAAFRAQNAVMAFVAASGLVLTTTPVPLAGAADSDDPEAAAAIATIEGRRHVVRLLTWVPGAVLGARRRPSPALQRNYGAFVARLSLALAKFEHPAFNDHVHEWSLEGVATRLRAKLPRVPSFDAEQRALVLGAIERLEAALGRGGGGARLPRQVCHTDANEQNVLVDGARKRIVGLLDWGDATRCYRVAEIAIATAYGMLLAHAEEDEEEEEEEEEGGDSAGGERADGGGGDKGSGGEGTNGHGSSGSVGVADGGGSAADGDPLAVGRAMLAGYLEAGGPLGADEADALPALVGARIAQSLTNGAFAAAQAPGNSAYLLITQRPGWRVLRRLQALPEAEVRAALLPAAGGDGGGVEAAAVAATAARV